MATRAKLTQADNAELQLALLGEDFDCARKIIENAGLSQKHTAELAWYIHRFKLEPTQDNLTEIQALIGRNGHLGT